MKTTLRIPDKVHQNLIDHIEKHKPHMSVNAFINDLISERLTSMSNQNDQASELKKIMEGA